MVSMKLDDGGEVHNHDVMLTDVLGEWLKGGSVVKTNDDVVVMVGETILDAQKTFQEQQITEGTVVKVMPKGQALAIEIGGRRKKANFHRRAAQMAKRQEAAKSFGIRRRVLL